MRTTRLLCDEWKFAKCAFGTGYKDAAGFEEVDLPHDWLIYDTLNLYETSTGWYKRGLEYTNDGNRRILKFEGVYMDSHVYVNGLEVFEWKYGYTVFEVDITDCLKEGENEIAVRVDHKEPNSRWYSGAGIYRPVYLITCPAEHITFGGVYISAYEDGRVLATVRTERPVGVQAAELKIRNRVFFEGKQLAETVSSACALDISLVNRIVKRDGCLYTLNTDTLKVESPNLWDIDSPVLYTLVTDVIKDGEVIDTVTNTFGFRTIEFTTDKGFFLNHRHVKLHGACEHHDLGALGSAFNKAAMRRKLVKLREMGVNAIRTSHNPPATEWMELFDEMGFLCVSEAFDMWEMQKTEYDYGRFFKEWSDIDVASWVLEGRNHPSIIAWSIGNEIYDTHASEHGQEIASRLVSHVREHDFRSNAYVTQGSNFMQWENAQKCADILKIAGYNYAERLYQKHHEEHPDWCIYGSETSSVTQSRGIYHFPKSERILTDDDEQCSSLGNTSPGWASPCDEANIIPDRDTEFCAGQFIWTGFDYIGEPTPYSTKNSYFGQIDTAGFEKDSAYIYRGAWTDHKKAPFVHIFPYWDFTPGQDIDVRVATNCPHVKLFLNGKEVLDKHIDLLHGKELTADTVLKYVPGELVALGFDEDGNEIAREIKRSFTDAKKICVSADKTVFKADGQDMVFLAVTVLDKDGNEVENANNRIFVSAEGAGRIVGLDNGDSTDYDSYKGLSRRLFSGKMLVMAAAKTVPGIFTVRLSSPGLEGIEITLTAEPAKVSPGVSANTENAAGYIESREKENDIPVRKIELLSESTQFDADNRELKFKTVIYPADSVYSGEIIYRLVTVLGIDTNVAAITDVSDGYVTVKALGDGEFYLRALCKNGTNKYHIMSQIKLTSEGLGSATFDPYTLVKGGLRTYENGAVVNGIEKGAEFMGKERGIFGFENVDFGKYGSDTVTLPIFANKTTPVFMKIYDGHPDEGGELVADIKYHVQPIWLVYQSQTYRLSKTLRGIHALYFVSEDDFDIEGFVFEKPVKEDIIIPAGARENVYGDKFTENGEEIKGIGNNVVVDFGDFDFTGKAPVGIKITAKSSLPVNSIHVSFTGDEQTRILCEFEKAEEYTERYFDLSGISGKGSVSLIFLPGCDIDLKSIQFVY
jgi:beta-galactosidase